MNKFIPILAVSFMICRSDANAQSGWMWRNPLPQGNTLRDVSFVTHGGITAGTAVGETGTIIRTTDGGASWVNQSVAATDSLYGVSFIDANMGMAVGTGGLILRTTDGGAKWKFESRTTIDLYGVSFTDIDKWIAVGDTGAILRTTDGGASWTRSSSGTKQSLQSCA